MNFAGRMEGLIGRRLDFKKAQNPRLNSFFSEITSVEQTLAHSLSVVSDFSTPLVSFGSSIPSLPHSGDVKGSDLVLEAILEAEVAHNAKEFFSQPQNQI